MAAEASRKDSQPFDMRLSETATAQDVSEAALNAYAHILGEEPSLELLVRRGLLDGKSGILDSMGGAGAHYSVSRELGSDHTKLTLVP